MGTRGYFPENRYSWLDSDEGWEKWALGAIILEADLPLNSYYKTKSADDGQARARLHIKEPQTCKHIVKLVKQTMLMGSNQKLMSWEDMVSELKAAKFLAYHTDYNQ
jgi:hypothetical protein